MISIGDLQLLKYASVEDKWVEAETGYDSPYPLITPSPRLLFQRCGDVFVT
jgi:hypothetical protein